MAHKSRLQHVQDTLDHQIDDTVIIDEDHDISVPDLMMYAFRASPVAVIFSGDTTDECRQALYNNLLEQDHLKEAITELMAFTRRSRRAATRWITGESIPQRADWLKFQYWLRARGYHTRELDGMANSFFQLRKMIICGEICFAETTKLLKLKSQHTLWALLNNELDPQDPDDREILICTLGRAHALVRDINEAITRRELVSYLEVELDVDGEFTDIKKRFRIGKKVPCDEAAKLAVRA